MKKYEVRLTDVFHVEAETEEEAYILASAVGEGQPLSDDEITRVDYLHGDDLITLL